MSTEIFYCKITNFKARDKPNRFFLYLHPITIKSLTVKPLYLLLAVLLFSCSDPKSHEAQLAFKPADQIDYYHLNYSDDQLHVIFTTENISMEERKLAEILYHSEPDVVTDSAFVAEMESGPYFVKTTIAKKDVAGILDAFMLEKPLLSASMAPITTLCAPTYRDILVLRKNKKITGYAKICFECDLSHLVGMQTQTETVQTNYEALQKLLQTQR